MWAEALALNNSLGRLAKLNRSLHDFHYGDSEMAEIFRQEMYRVNFSGISVNISYALKVFSYYKLGNQFLSKDE